MPRQNLIYELHIQLAEVEPPIWRTILVDYDISLRQLHHILQVVFGWESRHLHQFVKGKTLYTEVDETPRGWRQVSDFYTPLFEVAKQRSKFVYEYDFGDGWIHTIKLKAVFSHNKKLGRAILVGGERNGASEDSGGPHGYMEFLVALKRQDNSPESKAATEYYVRTGLFNPEFCDLRGINAALVRLSRNGAEF